MLVRHSVSKHTFFGKKNPVRQINDGNQETSSRDLYTKSVVYNEINDDLVSLRMKILIHQLNREH